MVHFIMVLRFCRDSSSLSVFFQSSKDVGIARCSRDSPVANLGFVVPQIRGIRVFLFLRSVMGMNLR